MAINALPLQLVCEMARNIPGPPWLLPQLMALLKSDNSTSQQIELLLRKDAGLAAAVLRSSNSAYFSAEPCESLSEAVVRLGFKEIYRLATTHVSGRWLRNDVHGYGWEPGDLYKHSICVAAAAENLVRQTQLVEPELAYTAGLLHDIGKLALAHACADTFEDIRKRQAELGCAWRQAEFDLLGYDHTVVGGTLLESWNFPVSLVQVACYYSRPRLASVEDMALVVTVHAAKHLSLAVGYGVGEDGFTTELDEESLMQFGYTPEMLEASLPAVVEAADNLLKHTL